MFLQIITEKSYTKRWGLTVFLSLEDFEGDQTIRGFISDEACFDKIVGMIEEEENPLFTFCVTMQNHSPYTKSYDASVKLTEYKDERVDQYLSLVHESDRALQNLIEHLKESDEPTVVVFFWRPSSIVIRRVLSVSVRNTTGGSSV